MPLARCDRSRFQAACRSALTNSSRLFRREDGFDVRASAAAKARLARDLGGERATPGARLVLLGSELGRRVGKGPFCG